MSIKYNNPPTGTKSLKTNRLYTNTNVDRKQNDDYYDVGGFNEFWKDQLIQSIKQIKVNAYVDINIREMISKLNAANSTEQLLYILVMSVIKAKDQQQITCKFINSRLQKQLTQQRQIMTKYQKTIKKLQYCYEESKQEYLQMQNNLRFQLRKLQQQNSILVKKVQQLTKTNTLLNQNIYNHSPIQSLNYNNNYQSGHKTIKMSPRIRRIQSQFHLSSQRQLLRQLQNLQKQNKRSNQVTFCENRSAYDYDYNQLNNMEILRNQIIQLRQNHKKLQNILLERDKQIASLAKVLNLSQNNDL